MNTTEPDNFATAARAEGTINLGIAGMAEWTEGYERGFVSGAMWAREYLAQREAR